MEKKSRMRSHSQGAGAERMPELARERQKAVANAKREREEAPGWLRDMGVPEPLIAICMGKFPELCGFQIYALLWRLRAEIAAVTRAADPMSKLSEDELEEILGQRLSTASPGDIDRILGHDYPGTPELVGRREMQSA